MTARGAPPGARSRRPDGAPAGLRLSPAASAGVRRAEHGRIHRLEELPGR
ncbi:hypothetical protein OG429_05935 [Streptomyces sp. NBC_00190]|nr:hypothetical protein [Streptomyces sp. NBC_00190]WSZ38908.1 hypothetical protein OG239_08945 [Streptomyces sp. NBC_00868]